jgi:hypothetical protein
MGVIRVRRDDSLNKIVDSTDHPYFQYFYYNNFCTRKGAEIISGCLQNQIKMLKMQILNIQKREFTT